MDVQPFNFIIGFPNDIASIHDSPPWIFQTKLNFETRFEDKPLQLKFRQAVPVLSIQFLKNLA